MIPIYHLHVRIIKRTNARGERRSIVAEAGHRSGERLYDDTYERHWNCENKPGKTAVPAIARVAHREGEHLHDEAVGQSWNSLKKFGLAHSEISCPDWAPQWMGNREKLWNAVDRAEKRHNARLAREVQVALPNFFTVDQNIALVRAFVQREFVSKGMVADWSIHCHNQNNLCAHILLTTRNVAPEAHVLSPSASHEVKHAFKFGFLRKNRDWNSRQVLMQWREGWANVANEHLAAAGYALKIDHRSYKARGIALIPQTRIGVSRDRRNDPNLPADVVRRIRKHERIAEKNGERIIEDPGIALRAITQSQSIFTDRDIARFLHGHTHGEEQFQRAYSRVMTSPELVQLTVEGENKEIQYTTHAD